MDYTKFSGIEDVINWDRPSWKEIKNILDSNFSYNPASHLADWSMPTWIVSGNEYEGIFITLDGYNISLISRSYDNNNNNEPVISAIDEKDVMNLDDVKTIVEKAKGL